MIYLLGMNLSESYKKRIQELSGMMVNESNIWTQGGILLIKGAPKEDGTQRLYATEIKNLLELKPGVKMAILGDNFYRIRYDDNINLKAIKVSYKNEPSLAQMLNFKNHKLSVVLNNNKTPIWWETLKFNNVIRMMNELKYDIQNKILNIEWH